MNFIKSTVIASVAALALTSGAAFAQKAPTTPKAPRSEASLACSKQADEQKLTGKPRKAFRTACLKKAKEAAKAAAPAGTTAPATKAPATTPTAPAKKN